MRKKISPKRSIKPTLKGWELQTLWDWDDAATKMQESIVAAVKRATQECNTAVDDMIRRTAEEAIRLVMEEKVLIDIRESSGQLMLSLEIDFPDNRDKCPRFEVGIRDALYEAMGGIEDHVTMVEFGRVLMEVAAAADKRLADETW